METRILKVVRQGEAFSVQSAKADGGQIQKCNIVLKELGGKFLYPRISGTDIPRNLSN